MMWCGALPMSALAVSSMAIRNLLLVVDVLLSLLGDLLLCLGLL